MSAKKRSGSGLPGIWAGKSGYQVAVLNSSKYVSYAKNGGKEKALAVAKEIRAKAFPDGRGPVGIHKTPAKSVALKGSSAKKHAAGSSGKPLHGMANLSPKPLDIVRPASRSQLRRLSAQRPPPDFPPPDFPNVPLKIERGIPVPAHYRSQTSPYAPMSAVMAQMSPGESVLLPVNSRTAQRLARRVFGAGKYSIRKELNLYRVWRTKK